MSSSLLERLETARRQRFVGRVNERELFQTTLTALQNVLSVLYLFGAGGVGKTTLLANSPIWLPTPICGLCN